jgi:hypothetical protein
LFTITGAKRNEENRRIWINQIKSTWPILNHCCDYNKASCSGREIIWNL